VINIIAYLLPMSGDILVKELVEDNRYDLRRAVIPESFAEDCQNLMEFLDQNDIPYRVPTDLNDESFRQWVEDDHYDIGVSVGFDKKLPGWLIGCPEHGTLNIHPSLLPRYRGANPYFWVIHNRESTTGVTLHYMDQQFDTGPVIRQESVELQPDETMGSLFFLLNRMGVDMATDVLEELERNGTTPEGTDQEDGDYPAAPEVQNHHLRIDWEKSFEDVDALVRAGNPFFGAYTTFRGATVRVFEVERVSDPPESLNERPGSVEPTEHGPVVRCQNDAARLCVVQMEQQYKSTGRTFQQREQKAFEVLDRMI
jgi:methionyl-tRNA formyltransferase